MNSARYFEEGVKVPAFYNTAIVDYYHASISKTATANPLGFIEMLLSNYAKLSPSGRSGEHGFAILQLLETTFHTSFESRGKLGKAACMLFSKHQAALRGLPDKTKGLDDLLHTHQLNGVSKYVTSGVLHDVPLRVIPMRCARCAKVTVSCCSICRERFYCSVECQREDGHTKRECAAGRNGFVF